MNFTYLELATLKYAASKLLECVHQIEAVNITTGGNDILVSQEYIDMLLNLWERLCSRIQFDLIESWEDMAYKCGSIISPEHFSKFLAPQYRKIRAFADAHTSRFQTSGQSRNGA